MWGRSPSSMKGGGDVRRACATGCFNMAAVVSLVLWLMVWDLLWPFQLLEREWNIQRPTAGTGRREVLKMVSGQDSILVFCVWYPT